MGRGGVNFFSSEIGHVGYQKIRILKLIRLSLLTFSLKRFLKRVKIKKLLCSVDF